MASLNQARDTSESISCTYSKADPQQLLATSDVLAVVGFDAPCRDDGQGGLFQSGLRDLAGSGLVEAWYSNLPLQHGAAGGCHWSSNDEWLFLGCYVDEDKASSQREAVRDAYDALLALAEQKGYPHLIRVWNYMAEINRGEGDDERYRQFCLGRLDAFTSRGYDLPQFPAACALGHAGGHTIIYLLASRSPGQHFENPQQTSAYRYPERYGPASPSFARATLAEWSGGRQLYLSGTASIIGHQSQHGDAIELQTLETCRNIDALLQHVANQVGHPVPIRPGTLKIYLRHPEHLAAARNIVGGHFGADVQTLYLQADICRRELLVEIDGICHLD